jgi:TonB family protein
MRDREQFRSANLFSVLAPQTLLMALVVGAVSFLVVPLPLPYVPYLSHLPPPTPASSSQRIGTALLQLRLVHKVIPRYPAKAKEAGVKGVVILEARIDKRGTIANLKVHSGHSLLTGAAMEAVRYWRYEPSFLNEEPMDVIATIALSFP